MHIRHSTGNTDAVVDHMHATLSALDDHQDQTHGVLRHLNTVVGLQSALQVDLHAPPPAPWRTSDTRRQSYRMRASPPQSPREAVTPAQHSPLRRSPTRSSPSPLQLSPSRTQTPQPSQSPSPGPPVDGRKSIVPQDRIQGVVVSPQALSAPSSRATRHVVPTSPSTAVARDRSSGTPRGTGTRIGPSTTSSASGSSRAPVVALASPAHSALAAANERIRLLEEEVHFWKMRYLAQVGLAVDPYASIDIEAAVNAHGGAKNDALRAPEYADVSR
jgi:hypothetical protein